MATKKAGGSSRNGRDSAGRRLCEKIWWRNRGARKHNRKTRNKNFSSENVGMGKDHSIFSVIKGKVVLKKLNQIELLAVNQLIVQLKIALYYEILRSSKNLYKSWERWRWFSLVSEEKNLLSLVDQTAAMVERRFCYFKS